MIKSKFPKEMSKACPIISRGNWRRRFQKSAEGITKGLYNGIDKGKQKEIAEGIPKEISVEKLEKISKAFPTING